MATTIANRLSSSKHQFSVANVPSLTGFSALITGGTEGIGHATAANLLKADIDRLLIITRNSPTSERVQTAVKQWHEQEVPNTKRVVWKQCDLGELAQVKKLGDEILREEKKLDLIINNAAIGIYSYQKSTEGLDYHMAVNHFGHALLTAMLLPLLEKSTTDNDARIVNLSSNLHSNAPSGTRFESVDEMNQDLGPLHLYARTKLANVLHARWFTRHRAEREKAAKAKGQPLMKIRFNAVHPGVILTEQQGNAAESYGVIGKAMLPLIKPALADTSEGCISSLYAATGAQIKEDDVCGQYIEPPAHIMDPNPMAQDDELGERLMTLTKQMWKTHAGVVDLQGY